MWRKGREESLETAERGREGAAWDRDGDSAAVPESPARGSPGDKAVRRDEEAGQGPPRSMGCLDLPGSEKTQLFHCVTLNPFLSCFCFPWSELPISHLLIFYVCQVLQ